MTRIFCDMAVERAEFEQETSLGSPRPEKIREPRLKSISCGGLHRGLPVVFGVLLNRPGLCYIFQPE